MLVLPLIKQGINLVLRQGTLKSKVLLLAGVKINCEFKSISGKTPTLTLTRRTTKPYNSLSLINKICKLPIEQFYHKYIHFSF